MPVWIDLPSQLNEVRALLPSLAANDILKVTLAANPSVLGTKTGANDPELFERQDRRVEEEITRYAVHGRWRYNGSDE